MGKTLFSGTAIGQLAARGSSLNAAQVEAMAFKPQVLTRMDDLNVNQLVEFGVFSDNTKTPDYRPATIEIKKAKGQPWQHMTFYDTGRTLMSIRYEWHNGIEIYMEDRFDLLTRYSRKILGLTDGSWQEVIPKIRRFMVDAFKKKIFL